MRLINLFSPPKFSAVVLFIFCCCNWSCKEKSDTKESDQKLQLITLEPGHFHAALIQKYMYDDVDSTVHVYAPEGPELKSHLGLIKKYNDRAEDPTHWKEEVYSGSDYLQKMLSEKPGGIVVIAGNNQRKTMYIKQSVEAGLNVLGDKPMAITTGDFAVLKDAFAAAEKNKLMLYDIMTSRYEITNIIQRELAHTPEIFGELEKGSAEDPAVTIVRRHYFLKYVSGAPLVRPVWYFDTDQEGKGIVDVTTHLVDQVQWVCFPESVFDYTKDIQMNTAKRWPTAITKEAFTKVTNAQNFPDFLQKDIKDSVLYVDANGEMNYTIKGIHAKITMLWDVQPTEDGAGDAHFSTLRGTKARLAIRQGKEEQFHPVLYIEKNKINDTAFSKSFVESKMQTILQKYPGITLKENAKGWELIIPAKYSEGHEQNFRKVATKFLDYVRQKKMPDWEISAMLAKYYTTTQALEKSVLGK